MASLRGRRTLLAALATIAAAAPTCDNPAPSPPLPCGTGAYEGFQDDEYRDCSHLDYVLELITEDTSPPLVSFLRELWART